MLIAKLALDIESKHSPDFIAKWDYDDLPQRLWPISPLSEMWGIGRNMEAHLNKMGMHTIGDIAQSDVKRLKRKFGIIGEELYYHTHGIDLSRIQDKNKIKPISKSYGTGQTLFRDYYPPDVYQIIIELIDDVARRLRISKKRAKTIHFGIGYSKDAGGGFSRQITLDEPPASESEIYKACLHLFNTYYDKEPIRRVHVSVSHLVTQPEMQLNLFEDIERVIKEADVFSAIDEIKYKYGKNAVNRASSELKASTIKARNDMIGGHRA
jgi:DNA polymerase V